VKINHRSSHACNLSFLLLAVLSCGKGASRPPAPPAAPTGLLAVSSGGAVTLTWTASAGANGYVVRRRSDGAGKTDLANTAGVSYIDSTAAAGLSWFYSVAANNGSATSADSAEAAATLAPAAPTLTAALDAQGRVALSWTAAPGAVTYAVSRSTGTAAAAPVAGLEALTTTTTLDTSAQPGTPYKYTVRATNAGGNGPDSTPASVTTQPPASVGGVPPATGAVTGTVVDATTGAAISGVTVQSGTASAVTGNDGAFQLTLPVGRAVVAASGSGYLGWRREYPVAQGGVPALIKLVLAAAPQTVTASGSTVTAADGTTLEFAAGSYASDTPISATWMNRTHVGSIVGHAQFLDASGTIHRALGGIHVGLPGEPSVPVTLSVPVPATATMQNTSYFPVDAAGNPQTPIKPSSVSGGVARFQVPHFDDGEVTTDVPPGDPTSGSLISTGSSWDNGGAAADPNSAASWTPPNGTAMQPLLEGDQLDVGSIISTPSGFSASVALPDGSSLTLAPNTVMNVVNSYDGLAPTVELESGTIHQVDVPRPPLANGQYKSMFKIRTHNSGSYVGGVRGTAFSASVFPCGQSGHHAYRVSVSDGAVDMLYAGQVQLSVTSGQTSSGCLDCAAGDTTSCGAALGATDFCNRMYEIDQGIFAGCELEKAAPPFALGLRDCQNVAAGLAAGRIRYESSQAQACLDALSASSCEWWGNHLDWELAPCAAALHGTVQPGGACVDTFDCSSYNCVSSTTCPGSCGNVETIPPRTLTLGQVCDTNNDLCVLGTQCDSQASRCVRPVPEGGACTVGNYQCAPNLYCSAAHVCTSGTAPAGAPCGTMTGSEFVRCAQSLHCFSGVCGARKESGACTSNGQCASVNCLNGQCAQLCSAP
jgi:hypothetical protein